ncbi:hypothetical protein Dda_4041 [Drechslerella dactyloides]|uniref:Uncharacterized protein n=1 Tax=Drechslerella dactyloides TaxID=74499 RepID=A0AAD6NJ27_DREDA|nr:hypothetical protein Dda_4041 [Drechslerella dactyloides]
MNVEGGNQLERRWTQSLVSVWVATYDPSLTTTVSDSETLEFTSTATDVEETSVTVTLTTETITTITQVDEIDVTVTLTTTLTTVTNISPPVNTFVL